MVAVVLTPRPLAEPKVFEQPTGRTVRAMLLDAVRQGAIEAEDLGRAELHVDGVTIDRDRALDHVLSEGQVVNLVVYAHGGGGGGGKDVGQVLLQIAVIAVTAWISGGAATPALLDGLFARTALAATFATAANYGLNSLYSQKGKAEKANDRYALQAASNKYRQWGPMPLILGESVIAPDLATKTFTRTIGDDVWIYGVLGHHYGACTLDELKIGDTLVSSMGAGDAKFVHHLTPGPRTFSLVPNDIDQIDLAPEELVATTTSATAVVRAVEQAGERFEFDWYLPGGLYFAKDDGRKITASVTVTVRYRAINANGTPVGAGTWSNGLTVNLSSATSDPMRVTRELALPMGLYEFEHKRSLLPDSNEKRHTDISWSAVRSIAFRKPIADETLAISEFAIRATALNQGTLAPITCRITPICEVWNGTTWGNAQPTSNPAALTRWLLTGPAPAKPLLSAQADVGLRAWSALCDQYDWTAHIPILDEKTQAEALGLLERAGRAGVFWDGSAVVASCWVEKPVPKQMFTGVNLKGHAFEIAYADPLHAYRVEFQNLEQGGEWDELYVYNDGYAETAGAGLAAATLVEALRLEDGQKTQERAYRDGRWEMARRIHQRRVDSWTADAEAVVSRYGDRVRLAWLRASGEGGARVRARRWSAGEGSTVTGLRLDRDVEFLPGETYVVDLRLVSQLLTGVAVVNPATSTPVLTREITFAAARSAALSPRRGDLIAFGPAEAVAEDVELIAMDPAEGLTASLTGIRYVAPLLMAAETGPIPELQTRLTRDRSKAPPSPTLLGAVWAETGARVTFSMHPWRGSPLTGFSVRWRQSPAAGQTIGWTPLPDLAANAMTLVTPPARELPGEDDVTRIEVEITALTAAGQASTPMIATVVQPTVVTPPAGDWTVVPRPADPSGEQQPGLVVSGSVSAEGVSTVRVSYGLSATGPWTEVYAGPPSIQRLDILGLSPSVAYWVAFAYLSPQGVPSGFLVKGPYTAPGLIAGGVGGETSAELFERFEDIAETILRVGHGQRQLQEHVDIRTWIDGKDIGTYVVDRFVTVEDDNYALASQIIFLGARTDEAQAYNYREFSALATDLQALAYSHEILSAEYDDTSVELGFLLEVMAGPGGGSALMALYTDVNGYIAGGYSLNDGTTADTVWLADRFAIGSPGSPGKYPFLLIGDDLFLSGDLNVDGNVIVGGTIASAALANGSVQRLNFNSLGSDFSAPYGSTTSVMSVSITKSEPDSVLEIFFYGMFKSDDDLIFATAFRVSGGGQPTTDYPAGTVNLIFDNTNSAAQGTQTPFRYLSGLPAGNYTITLRVNNGEPDGAALKVLAGSTLKVVELKRPAL